MDCKTDLIRQDIIDQFSSVNFTLLTKCESDYDERSYSRIHKKTKNLPFSLVQDMKVYQLSTLQRSRYLFNDFIDTINHNNVLLSHLAARAHLETTGSLAYFVELISNFLNSKDTNVFSEKILRLVMGSRIHLDESTKSPQAIGVLSLIDTIDNIAKKAGWGNTKSIRHEYDRLSELCHPNLLGRSIGINIADDGIIFHGKPIFDGAHIKLLVNDICFSCGFFFKIYDICSSLIDIDPSIIELEK